MSPEERERRPGPGGAVPNTINGLNLSGPRGGDAGVRVRLDEIEQRVAALEQCVIACSPASCSCPRGDDYRREYHRHVITGPDGIERLR